MTISKKEIEYAAAHPRTTALCSNKVSEMARLLLAAQDELTRRDALAGEPVGYFAYSEDGGYEEFATQEKAIACAESDIDTARGDSCDGWPDSVTSIVWGVVMQRATQTGLREKDDNDNVASYITEVCDYDLLPAITSIPQPVSAIFGMNSHEKARLTEFAERYIQQQSKVISKLPTDICQEKLFRIALDILIGGHQPVRAVPDIPLAVFSDGPCAVWLRRKNGDA